jgi:hypothetical protein
MKTSLFVIGAAESIPIHLGILPSIKENAGLELGGNRINSIAKRTHITQGAEYLVWIEPPKRRAISGVREIVPAHGCAEAVTTLLGYAPSPSKSAPHVNSKACRISRWPS